MATVAVVTYTGARPVLVDIAPDTFAIDPARIEATITARTRAIVPVHLYGHPAEMSPILEIARNHGLVVIEDAAQAHGAEYRGRRVGSLADAACLSFYRRKNLGACGEAGIVVTNSADLAQSLRSLRDWGDAAPCSQPVRGFNYRMKAIQGAVLGIKLPHLEEWNDARRGLADLYRRSIAGPVLQSPVTKPRARHAFYFFAVRTPDREAAAAAFRRRGVETRIYCATPIHLMDRFRDRGYAAGDFPHAEQAASEVLSIPPYPELETTEVGVIVVALGAIFLGTKLCRAQAAPLAGFAV